MSSALRDALLPGIQSGDTDAFGRWMADAEPRIRLSLSRFATAVDTEAVLQEALLRVWQVAPRVTVDSRGDALLRLGVRVARNLAVDHLRASQKELNLAETDGGTLEQAAVDIPPPDPYLRQAIVDCVEQLPSKPGAAFKARIENGGGEADELLAERLSMRLNTFLKNFGRARRFLIECLEGRGVEWEAG